jgi:hypothetical protein
LLPGRLLSMIKKVWSKYLVVILLFCFFSLEAQPSKKSSKVPGGQAKSSKVPGGQAMNLTPGTPIPANPVPITGIEILLGAGALLGARRFMAGRKKKESE